MTTLSLIDKLRRRIKDDRPNVRALSLSVSDESCARAIVEVTDNHLIITTSGGSVTSIDFNLSDSRYSTVGRLHQQLTRINGLTVSLDEDAQEDHLCVDLYPLAPMDAGPGRSSAELKHHMFSDSEMEEILQEAVTRHNPSFTISLLPSTEEVFVLQLAHAEVCRRQAYDGSKRKGMSETVSDLLQIATSLESAYATDVKRLSRAIASPAEATPNSMAQGDVVMGSVFKRSLRTGFMSPIGENLPPTAAVLLEADDVRDIEDENIRVRWQRNRDTDFGAQELWLDTQPDVEREVNADARLFAGTPGNTSEAFRGIKRPTTSKLIFRAYGGNSSAWTSAYRTFVEEMGQEIMTYNVGDLEPSSTYYIRLYIQDLNNEAVASNVVEYTTKPLRTRFTETSYATPLTGAAGTVVTVNFDTAYGAFTSQHKLFFGGFDVAATIINPYQVTFVVPSFQNKSILKDLTVVSPTKLYDVKVAAFTLQ